MAGRPNAWTTPYRPRLSPASPQSASGSTPARNGYDASRISRHARHGSRTTDRGRSESKAVADTRAFPVNPTSLHRDGRLVALAHVHESSRSSGDQPGEGPGSSWSTDRWADPGLLKWSGTVAVARRSPWPRGGVSPIAARKMTGGPCDADRPRLTDITATSCPHPSRSPAPGEQEWLGDYRGVARPRRLAAHNPRRFCRSVIVAPS